jgi:hypothetical protein
VQKVIFMIMQTKNGYPEVVLSSKCEAAFFYRTADWLRHEIGISFCNKVQHDNSIAWQFCFGTSIAVLKYDPVCGISLCPAQLAGASAEERAAFKMLTETLHYGKPNELMC